MTDKEFIDEHILNGWMINTQLPSYFVDTFFGVSSTDGNTNLPINMFLKYIKEFYGEWYCEVEGKYLSEIIDEWFETKKSEVLRDINAELVNLKVVLGPRSWQCVDEHGDIFFWKKLVLKFKDKYDKNLIKSVYDEWFENKVLETSEKMMDEPWS